MLLLQTPCSRDHSRGSPLGTVSLQRIISLQGLCHLCLFPAKEPGGKPPAGAGTSEVLLAPSHPGRAPTPAQRAGSPCWAAILSQGERVGCRGHAALAGPQGHPPGVGAVGSVRQPAQQRKGCALRQPCPAPLQYLRDSLPSPLPLAPVKAGSRKHMGFGPLTLTPPCPLLPLGSGFARMGFLLNPFPATAPGRCSSTPQMGFSTQRISRQLCTKSLPAGQSLRWGGLLTPGKKQAGQPGCATICSLSHTGPAGFGAARRAGAAGRGSASFSRDALPAERTSTGSCRHTSLATPSGWYCRDHLGGEGDMWAAGYSMCRQLPTNKAWCPQVTPRYRPGRRAVGKGPGRERKAGDRQRVAALPLPAAPALLQETGGAACWPQPASGQLGVPTEEDGGSPILWLGLIQTPPRPLTPSRPW